MKKQYNSERNVSRRLKVGFVFDDSLDSFDGVSQYVKAVGKWMTDQGHSVSYLVGETKMSSWVGGPVYSLSKNQKVSFNKNKLSIPLPSSNKSIKKIIEEGQYDILHVQMPYSPFMAGSIIKHADQKTAIIGTFHILPANKLAVVGSVALKLAYGRTLNRIDQIYSVSQAAQKFAKKVFGIESSILPNVVDVNKFHSTKKRVNHVPRIVFLGRLVQRKGCYELLKAYNLARANGLKAKLIIAGDGPERKKLEHYVNNKKMKNDVSFIGFISEEAKPDLLAGADIACFPATGGESFGIVLIEAMAAGSRVVLGGDNPGYKTVLGENPKLLIDPHDTNAFAERLKQLLSDAVLISKVDSWLRLEVKKYDVEYVGKMLESAYFSAIAKRQDKVHNVGHESE